ncbi:Uncharacterised protein [Salmonella enterica subsp. enterica]|uniref:Uncharacterized protein n=1 Tax=Salmonella enterica I TaxID=59201 RepID=A0A379VM04_SALET|nr:Uncharacterised protein [Salmonella enterica subsp. enterica]
MKRVFCHGIFQMIGRKVGVNHRHFYVCMTQNIAQYQYVSAVHHKMTGKRMAQYVSALAFRQVNTGSFYCAFKGFSAWRE